MSKKVKLVNARHYSDVIGETLELSSREKEYYEFTSSGVLKFENLQYRKIPVIAPGVFVVKTNPYGATLKNIKPVREPDVPGLITVDLSTRINRFFEKEGKLRELGLELVKYGILLHGPAGTGKTHSINNTVLNSIVDDGLALYFSMENTSIGTVVEFLDDNEPPDSIKKLFIIIEDLGGGERPDMDRDVVGSGSDLLTFLDGNSMPAHWQRMPIVIISTTNYPKLFLANLTDRPGRFDEVIEIPQPTPEACITYAESLLKRQCTDFELKSLSKGGLSLAHIRGAVIRQLVYDEPMHVTIEAMRAWSEEVKKSIKKKEGF